MEEIEKEKRINVSLTFNEIKEIQNDLNYIVHLQEYPLSKGSLRFCNLNKTFD